MNNKIESIIRAVAELPDRTSPTDFPNAMLITAEELEEILIAHGAFSQTEQKLDQPAQVGGTTFREGVKWETVINAAKRHYRHQKSQEKSKPIVSPQQLIQIALEEAFIVPKTPSLACLNSMAMRNRHDFGLLDDGVRQVIIDDMKKIYEEAIGQGFYKLGSEKNQTSCEGLGTPHRYLNHLSDIDKIEIKLSPEEAERLKAAIDTAKRKRNPLEVIFSDPVDAISHAFAVSENKITVGSIVEVDFISESRTEFSGKHFKGIGRVDIYEDGRVYGRLFDGTPFLCGEDNVSVLGSHEEIPDNFITHVSEWESQ